MVTEIMRNVWYALSLSQEVAPKKMKAFVLDGEPIVLTRKSNGEVFAIRDICPHRGIPFSYGQVVQDQVECPYHGWKFNSEGVCTEIPSLCEGQDLDCSKIKVKKYPVIEKQGLIWVFLSDKAQPLEPHLAPQPPTLPALPLDVKPGIIEEAYFPCHIDHAVIGLMDPAHGPYVHKSWFWRSSKSAYEKRKKFAPTPFGFQMVKHQPSKNSKAYKILGGQPTTEITFSIPGVRVEHIEIGNRHVYSLTILCPLSDKKTRVISMLYWDMPWVSIVKPIVKAFARRFLYQDLEAVSKQQEGLKFDPTLMLIRDSDTQAKWYYSLKNEWKNHQLESRPFLNPVKETELRWKS
jgi:phenylpropionate dioxygenase-like ring-hydroxylating dioxygenase large terminal subunit